MCQGWPPSRNPVARTGAGSYGGGHDRADADRGTRPRRRARGALDRWAGAQPFVAHLHSGDVGWHLRSPDDAVDGTLRSWKVDGETVAAGLLDEEVLRLAFAPGWSASPESPGGRGCDGQSRRVGVTTAVTRTG